MTDKIIKITDYISYIKAKDNPLSADIGLINGTNNLYIFDIGYNDEALEYINAIEKNKIIILSHFHQDHIKNINNVKNLNDNDIYVGNNTYKYIKKGNIVENNIKLIDGLEIDICPISSTHAKGSIIMTVNNEFTFVGDALYSTQKNDIPVYNVQLLKEQIDLLDSLQTKYFLVSHDEKYVVEKSDVINRLNRIYNLRRKSEPYIKFNKWF